MNSALIRSLMRLTLATSIVLALPITSSEARAETRAEKTTNKKTYALIVANNGSADDGVAPLRYADDDGARYYETFSALADQTVLLTTLDADSQRVFPALASQSLPPSRAQLKKSVAALADQIAADKKAGLSPEIYLVFTGHGNIDAAGEGYLSLSDGKLTRSDLYREVIRPLSASYTHLIIDACHAYFMVQSRGGGSDETWQDDRSEQAHDEALLAYMQRKKDQPSRAVAQDSTVGVILSTSGTAEVHEWSKLRAGVFSHQLRSALLGGADVDQDGEITYLEIEAFLAAANASITNPRARISVYARPPAQDLGHALLAIDDYRHATTLALPDEMEGRYHVEDARGLRYADLNKSRGQSARVVLLRAPVSDRPYYLRRDQEQARLEIGEDRSPIHGEALAFAQVDEGARSSVEESFRAELFSTPFGPGFYAGYLASRNRYESLLQERDAQSLRTAPSRWSLHPLAVYGVSSSPSSQMIGASLIQHNLSFSLNFESYNGWSIGPRLGYGVSVGEVAGQDQRSQVHRLSLGVLAGKRWMLGERFWIGPRVMLGEQALFLRDEALCTQGEGVCADPVGLRAEGLVAIGWRASERVSLELEGGMVADLFTRAGVEHNEETLFATPMIGLGARF